MEKTLHPCLVYLHVTIVCLVGMALMLLVPFWGWIVGPLLFHRARRILDSEREPIQSSLPTT